MGDFENVKALADLKEYAAQNLAKSKGGAYCCPACGSGTHGGRNSDGALTVKPDGTYWKCHSCQKGGDVFDLAGIVFGTDDKSDQLRLVAEWAGVTLERDGGAARNALTANRSAVGAREVKKATDTPKTDYTAGRERHRRYIAECAARMKDEPTDDVLSYLSGRGITHDDAVALGIGYDPNYKGKGETRVILPWSGNDYYHIDRDIHMAEGSGKYNKPKSDEVGGQPLYNPEAFGQDYVIAVEGVLDAISLQLCGYNAVALGGTDVNAFATEAAARNYGGVVIDMLDCDGDAGEADSGKRKGRGAGADLVSLLAEAGITTVSRAEYGVVDGALYGQLGNVSEGYKDAGEWYAADARYLKDFMSYAVKTARGKAKAAKEAEYRAAMRHLNVKDPARVALDVLELRDVYEPVPTGIASLDDALGGGVSLGETTFFGAGSSYGKTTLTVQIADHMAAAGRPVLFVTIEQSAKELVSKSLSRLVYTENVSGWNVATPNEITSLRARRAWGEGQNATLTKAVDDYSRMIAPRMKMLEGNKQPTVWDVRAIVEKMAEYDGQAPIVFIDYLQLLAPLSDRYDTDKRNADMNVSELRKMARDLNTHVWCISSLNRSSYSGVVSLDSFKESGGIEYGADNLLGLQPRNMAADLEGVSEGKMKREADQLIRENKKKPERDCEIVVLKHRNGALPDEPIPLTFKTLAACFIEPRGGGRAASQAHARTVL